jgi:hypothetical protein
MQLGRKLWQRGRDLLPTAGFHLDRPLLLLQSDDWGRAGLRDQEGLEQLREAGIDLGESPYDFYTLETAEDLAALSEVLKRHRDSAGRHPCLEMNFIVANLNIAKNPAEDRKLSFLSLTDGLPKGWKRPNLVDSYRAGIADGVFHAALHGTSHFCRSAVERAIASASERSRLLHALWRAGTPYIHWRMPWIGYEYWDPEPPEDERFLSAELQTDLIGETVGAFAKLFSALPSSACAPGYRANEETYRAWVQHGIRIAQSGPGSLIPPHFGRHNMLHLTRTVEFEPAVDPAFSVETCVRHAERCFEEGIPAIVSVHSINFHSTVRDFRSRTLRALDEFFAALKSKYPNLLYLDDEDLRQLVTHGSYETPSGSVQVNVTRKMFIKSAAATHDA